MKRFVPSLILSTLILFVSAILGLIKNSLDIFMDWFFFISILVFTFNWIIYNWKSSSYFRKNKELMSMSKDRNIIMTRIIFKIIWYSTIINVFIFVILYIIFY